MRLAVTGSRGQLARSLCELAEERGIAITFLARPGLDLANEATVRRAVETLDCDVLINAAAYTAVDRAEAEPDTAFAINADGAGAVARACALSDIPIIHISTDYVFDGSKAGAYLETDATRPMNVYGRSKSGGEEQVARAGLRHIILRTAWVHSPFGSNFVKTMLRLGKERREISVVSDQYGTPTYAPHLAEAIVKIAEHIAADPAGAPWGIYHYADSGKASWCDVAKETFAASRRLGGPAAEVRAITTAEYPTAATRPMNSCLSTDKFTAAFGMHPPHWREGVVKCVTRCCSGRDV